MVGDEVLIERIRAQLHAELDRVSPRQGFLDGVWDDAHADRSGRATAAFAARRRFGRIPRPPAGAIAIVASVAVAIGIGAIALVDVDTPQQRRSATATAATQREFRRFIDILGVLRRPQTPADLDSALLGIYAPGAAARVFPPGELSSPLGRAQLQQADGIPARSLIRVVPAPQLNATVTIIPVRFPAFRSHGASEAVNLILHGPSLKAGIDAALGTANPASLAALRQHGAFVVARDTSNGATAVALLVPDGVVKVILGPFRAWNYLPHGKTLALHVNLRHTRPVTSTVNDNVAAFKLGTINAVTNHPGPTAANILILARMTWYYADGTAVTHSLMRLGAWTDLHRER